MFRVVKKIVKYLSLIFGVITMFLIGSVLYLYFTAEINEPELDADISSCVVNEVDGVRRVENGVFRVSESGLLELKVKGNPSEIGVAIGALMEDYLRYQEDVFVDQIMEIIPSMDYLKFLRSLIVIFNRNITDHIPVEYQQEILGISQYCTDKYNEIGTPFERQLNYHAAHDIGHAMQQYMLVGCSSFVLNNECSEDGELVVGRNFDFYVGDDFAKNKLVMFVEPQSGYRFASVSWPGMMGVLSGMNEKGVSVTINAAKGDIPTSSSTPISILVREILQYSSNLEEAIKIAHSSKTFVSESILVASASDKNAIIIEKTPDELGVFRTDKYPLVCTNHFQSATFKDNEDNIQNIKNSDSKYRFDIIDELLSRSAKHSVSDVVTILRNRYGKDGIDVGVGNEMSLNQSIAHHSVVFKPESGLMWVSTSPWQSGKYVCYDLKEIFSNDDFSKEVYDRSREIAMDTTFMERDYQLVLDYRNCVKKLQSSIRNNVTLPSDFIAEFKEINPNNYYTYRLLGDYYSEVEDSDISIAYYKKSLEKEIPQLSERISIEQLIK